LGQLVEGLKNGLEPQFLNSPYVVLLKLLYLSYVEESRKKVKEWLDSYALENENIEKKESSVDNEKSKCSWFTSLEECKEYQQLIDDVENTYFTIGSTSLAPVAHKHYLKKNGFLHSTQMLMILHSVYLSLTSLISPILKDFESVLLSSTITSLFPLYISIPRDSTSDYSLSNIQSTPMSKFVFLSGVQQKAYLFHDPLGNINEKQIIVYTYSNYFIQRHTAISDGVSVTPNINTVTSTNPIAGVISSPSPSTISVPSVSITASFLPPALRNKQKGKDNKTIQKEKNPQASTTPSAQEFDKVMSPNSKSVSSSKLNEPVKNEREFLEAKKANSKNMDDDDLEDDLDEKGVENNSTVNEKDLGTLLNSYMINAAISVNVFDLFKKLFFAMSTARFVKAADGSCPPNLTMVTSPSESGVMSEHISSATLLTHTTPVHALINTSSAFSDETSTKSNLLPGGITSTSSSFNTLSTQTSFKTPSFNTTSNSDSDAHSSLSFSPIIFPQDLMTAVAGSPFSGPLADQLDGLLKAAQSEINDFTGGYFKRRKEWEKREHDRIEREKRRKEREERKAQEREEKRRQKEEEARQKEIEKEKRRKEAEEEDLRIRLLEKKVEKEKLKRMEKEKREKEEKEKREKEEKEKHEKEEKENYKKEEIEEGKKQENEESLKKTKRKRENKEEDNERGSSVDDNKNIEKKMRIDDEEEKKENTKQESHSSPSCSSLQSPSRFRSTSPLS
jgi:hypothetical protein